MEPTVTLIAAVARNGVIGQDGDLPWHLPADLRHFKEQTLGKTLIMGRRTHESVGRALPGRINIVISGNPDYAPAEGCLIARSPVEALALCDGAEEVMVVGGAHVYEAFLPFADRIVLTRVDAEVPGDTLFPELDASTWEVVSERVHDADDRHAHPMRFQVLERRPR